jgi:cytosine/adenosine deaminase-related metal-dependent hydrolase
VRRISASWIITLSGPSLKNGIIEVDESGTITAVCETPASSYPGDTEYFEGIIIPGFVNAHCHLELSHLKDRIPVKQGIGRFIGEINKLRVAEEREILQAASDADKEMFLEGIVAAGDISNTAHSIDVKKRSSIEWLTFVETFGFHPSRANQAIETALSIHSQFKAASLSVSVVPHSPYSVSNELFGKISGLEGKECSILSMHNQESMAENRFFLSGDGPIQEHITRNLGLDTSHWRPSGKSSLETVLPKLPVTLPLLLIHNTFSTLQDLRFIKKLRGGHPTWLVLCPNSNLFIENQLPPVQLFRTEKMQICLGTDSLASNTGLSVFSEIKTLHHHFPDIPLEELFTWACLNGATALGLGDRYGSLEVGKKPGILLITEADLKNGITPESEVTRLV